MKQKNFPISTQVFSRLYLHTIVIYMYYVQKINVFLSRWGMEILNISLFIHWPYNQLDELNAVYVF